MKLKYYLRGMGIGIILTAIVMGFALGGRKRAISDAEVIERAKALGMVEASGVLSQYAEDGGQNNENNQTAPDTSLDQKGEEVSEEVNQGISSTDQSISDLFEKTPEGENQDGENSDAVGQTEEDTETINDSASATSDKPEDTTEGNDNAAEDGEAEQDNTQVADNSQESEVTENDTPVSTGNFKTGETKTVNIPGGLSSDAVAAILYNEGLVDNATNFNRFLIERNMDRYIRSGSKTIPAGSDYEQIANIICKS